MQEGAEALYDVTLTDDVDALIAYYNSLQLYSEVELASIVEPAMLSKEEHTDMFLDCAARCKEKGTYFMAGISTKKGGTHAVVGMDEISGNWTFDGISYDTCIVTYDSNCVKPDTETSALRMMPASILIRRPNSSVSQHTKPLRKMVMSYCMPQMMIPC